MTLLKSKRQPIKTRQVTFSYGIMMASGLMSLCLVGHSAYAVQDPPPFPTRPPLEMQSTQAASPNEILFKLKKFLADRTNEGAATTPIAGDAKVAALAAQFNVSITPLLEKNNFKKEDLNPRLSQVYMATLPEGADIAQVLQMLAADPTIEYAEVNQKVQAVKMPNDSYLDYQWALHNLGQTGGIPDADIDAPEGWDIATGNSSTVLAVADTGVDWTHPELSGKVTLGWDFAYDDPYPDDVYGHGTHVAGIAAAKTDNNAGIAGTCWDCQILAVKVLDDYGSGWWDDVAEGISFATWNGAQIINLSLGGGASRVVHDAIKDAYDAGVTVVASAGNGYGPPVGYPAKYPETIAVSATNHDDGLAYFSSFGPEVDVAAPGEYILSILPGNDYEFWDGTSMAAPYVSGAIGVLLSVSAGLSPDEVRDCVMDSADDLGPPGLDDYFGAGRLNLESLLNCGQSGGGETCMGEACTLKGNGGVINGTLGNDVICGSDKNDIILAKNGKDLVCAGDGNDLIIAGNGHDRVDAGAGDDIVKGDRGRDTLEGGAGNDILFGGFNRDILIGGTGNDYLHGGNSQDVIFGHNGNDLLCGSGGKDYLNGGPDNDTCDEASAGCEIVPVPCPIANAAQIDPSFLTPTLENSIGMLKELGALGVNK